MPAHAYIVVNGGNNNGLQLNGSGPNGSGPNGANGTLRATSGFAIDGIELPAAR